MSERIRGAIFNMLGDISGLSVLDAFSGSGALAFEAVSRGAVQVTAIDIDKTAHRVIQENASALGISQQLKAIRANAAGWSANNAQARFDIVLCDLPFDKVSTQLLQRLAEHVRAGGLVVYSLPPKSQIELPALFHQVREKSFGDAKVVVYRRRDEV
jgi:16S rRNA (guanine966-N2)-methyltransferase